MEIIDTFQNRLKTAMNYRNVKQVDLVEKTKLDKTLINKYLAGVSNARQRKITILATALDVNEVWLMGYDVPMERNISKEITELKGNITFLPVYGKISAGEPVLAEQYLETYIAVDKKISGIDNSDDFFYLRVNGESMNKKVLNGEYVLIHKQDYAEDGDIIVAIVNGNDEATLKKFKKLNDQFILLEPMSSDPTFEPITVDLKSTTFRIIGKATGHFGRW